MFLIRLIGTPKTVEEYIKKSGINDIQITYNEEQMQAKWENMFQNWTTPKAASQTLNSFIENKSNLLQKAAMTFFGKRIKETTTGKNRIRGNCQKEQLLLTRQGRSGQTKKQELAAAVNDILVSFFYLMANMFIISVFVSESKKILTQMKKLCSRHCKSNL